MAPSFESRAEGQRFGSMKARVWSQNGGNGWEDLWGRGSRWFTVDRRDGYTRLGPDATWKDVFLRLRGVVPGERRRQPRVVVEVAQVIDGEVDRDYFHVDENGEARELEGDRPHHERDEVEAPR